MALVTGGKKKFVQKVEGKENSSLQVKIWGIRGSLASPLLPSFIEGAIRGILNDFVQWQGQNQGKVEDFIRTIPHYKLGGFGGNTTCVELRSERQQLIIDAGSGIRLLGYELMNGPCALGQGEVHLLFTHFHWDHLMGLPFFTPIFIPGNKIHVYSVQPQLKEIFESLFRKPFFPVPFEKLGGTLIFHQLQPRTPVQFEDIEVTPYLLDHPDECWGFRVKCGNKVYSHCVDTECIRVSPAQLGPDLPLYQGVDLMVFDAQYSLVETIEKVNWGHAAATLGLDIAMREGIKKVIFMHFDPAASNEKIAAAEKQTRTYYQKQIKHARKVEPFLHEVEWMFGYEGMVLDV